mmetsp:Transcript_1170/g.2857  ORF Transcript_1170/g.2857 Transcript_1170/m.2857 type:complete len:225 (+) Transcript_1170:989-1663(+)
MVVVDAKGLVGLDQLSPLVGLRSTQQFTNVGPLSSLDHFDVFHQQVRNSFVGPTDLVQLLKQIIQPFAASQALEHDILTLLHVFAGHLHPYSEPCGYIRSCGLQIDHHFGNNAFVSSSFAQHLRDDFHQAIKMVVSDVGFVVCWSKILAIVRRHTSKCSAHEGSNALLHAGSPGLVTLEKALHTRILSCQRVHPLSHVGDTLLAPKALVDSFGGDCLHRLLDVV